MIASTLLAATCAAILGAIVGSHVGLVADRLPRGESIVAGRSRCRWCGETLRVRELVPLLSYCVQRGRCRRCGNAVPPDALLAEIGGAVVGAAAAVTAPTWAGGPAIALFGWTLLLLALLDWRHFWLPDRITLPLAAAGIAAVLVLPDVTLTDRIAGAAIGFGVFAGVRIGYRMLRGVDGLGAGDAKLLAAIGAWLGWRALPAVVLIAASLGLAAVLVARLRGRAIGRQDALPFGTPLAVAAYVAAVAIG